MSRTGFPSELRLRTGTGVTPSQPYPAPEVYGAPYGSDLRLLTGIGGVATLQYGPGDTELAHGPRESVPVHEVLVTARTLAALALDICGVAN